MEMGFTCYLILKTREYSDARRAHENGSEEFVVVKKLQIIKNRNVFKDAIRRVGNIRFNLFLNYRSMQLADDMIFVGVFAGL